MLITQWRDLVRGLPSGGYLSSDQRESNEFIDKLIGTTRSIIIPQVYAKTKRIMPIWIQSYSPEYSKEYQDGYKGAAMFILPPVISLGMAENGYEYIGSKECNEQMRVWTNRSKFTSAISDPLMNPTSGRKMNILFEGANNAEVYAKLGIKTAPIIKAIFTNPMDVPSYNMLEDQYPMDEASGELMVKIMMREDMQMMAKAIVDRVKQGRDDTAIPVPRMP